MQGASAGRACRSEPLGGCRVQFVQRLPGGVRPQPIRHLGITVHPAPATSARGTSPPRKVAMKGASAGGAEHLGPFGAGRVLGTHSYQAAGQKAADRAAAGSAGGAEPRQATGVQFGYLEA